MSFSFVIIGPREYDEEISNPDVSDITERIVIDDDSFDLHLLFSLHRRPIRIDQLHVVGFNRIYCSEFDPIPSVVSLLIVDCNEMDLDILERIRISTLRGRIRNLETFDIESPHLNHITLERSGIERVDLSRCANVRSFVIKSSESIREIKLPRSIRRVFINGCGLDSLDVLSIPPSAALDSLSITDNNISDLTPLEKIHVSSVFAMRNRITRIPSDITFQCTFLNLSDNPIAEIEGEIRAPNLTKLILRNCDLKNPTIHIIGDQIAEIEIGGRYLESVTIENEINSLQIESSPNFKSDIKVRGRLRYLKLAYLPIRTIRLPFSVENLTIERCRNMRTLSDVDIPELKSILIHDLPITEIDLPVTPSLESIFASGMVIESFNDISYQPNLRKINIYKVNSLEGIEKFTNLYYLDLFTSSFDITDVTKYIDFITKMGSFSIFVDMKDFGEDMTDIHIRNISLHLRDGARETIDFIKFISELTFDAAMRKLFDPNVSSEYKHYVMIYILNFLPLFGLDDINAFIQSNFDDPVLETMKQLIYDESLRIVGTSRGVIF